MAGFPATHITDSVGHSGSATGTVVVTQLSTSVYIAGTMAATVSTNVDCSGGGGFGSVLSGAATGAVAGAIVGSCIPAVGTVVGAVVGAVVGGIVGFFAGRAHPPPPVGKGPIIVVGAGTVLINSKPAARWYPSGDLISCDADLGVPSGIRTVLIGGPTTTELALAELDAALTKRLAELMRWNAADKAQFKKWFGTDSEAARNAMIVRLKRMQALVKTYGKDNFVGFNPSLFDNNYQFYAQVRSRNDQRIELANSYAKSGSTGSDNRWGVIAHEMSHFNSIAGTNDNAYGQSKSLALAKKDSAEAMDNADSFEYWMEGQ